MVVMPRPKRRGLFGSGRNRRLRPKTPATGTPVTTPALRPPFRARLGTAMRHLGRHLRVGLKALVATLLAAAVGAGIWAGQRAVLSSPRFAVRDVVIGPTRHLTTAEVAAVIGALRGRNIFTVDPRRIERDLAAQPWVARATVRRELPGTIVVAIVEREPALLVELGGLYLADREGTVFKRAETHETEGLIIVTGLDREAYLRERLAAATLMGRAIALVTAYQGTPGRPPVGEVHIAGEDSFVLYTAAGGTAVRLGHGDVAAQFARFDLVWRALGQRQALARVIYLDNRTRPDRVTLRLDSSPRHSASAADPAAPGLYGGERTQ
jgi:cell division protein FtsQ